MEKCGKRGAGDGGFATARPAHEAVCLESASASAPLRTCSACAGDYEDPERTAGVFDEADDEERDETLHADVEEFPADDQ